ncbi:peptidoglycan-associated lipoprotein Pal [Zavarzinia compransoris]|uniref:Peptidoglycan-associated lipoprotein n=1 Tax=Zavarzinia compransoris TaxID=1264899 RepID=A0A317E6R5_9PROT|nr:peptidoglycan-associated lipoprotein Pal [Zavarzinia compransoris]PWR22252.1 peptidoglycan-associated lipoprotein Pal [Zavarzinia compransoris]TDP46989.1 peptidoglycan-associated lipoprotein [Zavarzinia compransoris]
MRFTHPGFKIAGIVASLFIVAACSSSNTDGAATTGGTTTGGIVPGSQEDLAATAGDSVFFALDQYNLSAQAQATLQAQAAWLAKYPSVTLTVEGHADERGTREYNLALGERRANSARAYLISLGVDANRLQVISYGKDRPFAVGSDETAWAQNRRAFSRVN